MPRLANINAVDGSYSLENWSGPCGCAPASLVRSYYALNIAQKRQWHFIRHLFRVTPFSRFPSPLMFYSPYALVASSGSWHRWSNVRTCRPWGNRPSHTGQLRKRFLGQRRSPLSGSSIVKRIECSLLLHRRRWVRKERASGGERIRPCSDVTV